ncbi:hypothetical protein ACP70R_008181 [Stipagrostis hirtigluma subsp. patula]
MAAAASSSEEKKTVAAPSVAAAGIPEGEKHAVDVAAAAEEDTGVSWWAPGPGETGTLLPEEFVDWILRRRRAEPEEDPDEYYARMIADPDRPEVYTPEFLEEERQLLRDMNELYRRVDRRPVRAVPGVGARRGRGQVLRRGRRPLPRPEGQAPGDRLRGTV